MRDTSVIEIDLASVASNLSRFRQMIGPGRALCPVLKADAYGLGAVRIAHVARHSGAEMLAVYTPDQAAEILGSAVGLPVLVLMPVQDLSRADEFYRGVMCGQVHLAVHDESHLRRLMALADRLGCSLKVHLEIDTGMSRGGCLAADAGRLIQMCLAHARLRLHGVFTHFSSSEDRSDVTEQQARIFDEAIEPIRHRLPAPCLIHLANTCAVLRDASLHRGMVRIGQGWAGYGPELMQVPSPAGACGLLRPCVTWSSRLVQIKSIPEGQSVGYGAGWTASRETTLGLIPVGYADGYPRALSGLDGGIRRAEVAVILEEGSVVRRAYAPVVGAVNMDQIMIDLTDLIHARESLRVGMPVELITPDREAPNHLVTLARIAQTSPYEILCRLSPRLRRVYHQLPAAEVIAPCRSRDAVRTG